MTKEQFGEKIKAKYPQYASLDNTELADKMLAKYPQYASQIDEGGFIQDIKDTVTNIISERDKSIDKNIAQRSSISPISAVADVASGVLGGISDLAGAAVIGAGKVLLPKVAEESIANTVSKVVSSTLDTDTARNIQDFYNGLSGDTKSNLAILGNTADFASNLIGGGVATKTAKQGLGEVSTLAKAVKSEIPNPFTRTADEAIANTREGILNIVEDKKSLQKALTKSEATGKDPLSVISENVDYLPKIDEVNKTLNFNDAIPNMDNDIATFSQVRDTLLQTADETLPLINTDDILNKALDIFSDSNYKRYLDEGVNAVNTVKNKLETLKKFNPDEVSRIELNEIRKALDETINTFTDTKLKDKVRIDLRKTFQQVLENSIPENGLLKDLNAQIGDIIDARNFARDKLNTTKVKNGRLGSLLLTQTGTVVGAGTGAVFGGGLGSIPGAIAGAYITNKLGNLLAKNAINSPFDRAVLSKLKQQVPEIVTKAEDYINTLKNKTDVKNEVYKTSKLTNLEVKNLNKALKDGTVSEDIIPELSSREVKLLLNDGTILNDFAKDLPTIQEITSTIDEAISTGDVKIMQIAKNETARAIIESYTLRGDILSMMKNLDTNSIKVLRSDINRLDDTLQTAKREYRKVGQEIYRKDNRYTRN